MASLASEVSGTRMVEFFDRWGRLGDGNMAKLKMLLGKDDLMKRWGETLNEFPEFSLVHGVFTKTNAIIANFEARCTEKGINFGKFSWIGSETATEFTDDPEVVVVLDVTLDTLQSTFEFAWAWTVDGQDDKWRWEGMVSDSKKLRLLSDDRPADVEGDGPDFKPWTLSWHRIKLNTNIGKRPMDVRNPKSSPGCALLFMSAEHPARVKATDYKTRFGYWLPGLKCTAPGEESFADVPSSDFFRDFRQVKLYSYPCGGSRGRLAVPSFQE